MKEATFGSGASLDLSIVSIHAPVKEATGVCNSNHAQVHSFNPRSREGSDPWIHRSEAALTGFNPRSREGSDASVKTLRWAYDWFQSTLP